MREHDEITKGPAFSNPSQNHREPEIGCRDRAATKSGLHVQPKEPDQVRGTAKKCNLQLRRIRWIWDDRDNWGNLHTIPFTVVQFAGK